jgi:hypothetical protein
MKRLLMPILVLLAACGTPQEQCIRQNTRDLRTVDKLIAETQGNLNRGYAYETITVTETYWRYCYYHRTRSDGSHYTSPQLCLDDRAVTVRRPKAIDLNEEARKLASLKEKRQELARRAEPVIAQCKAWYPE